MPIALAPPWKYHFSHAPDVFYGLWSVGGAAVVGCWIVAVRLLRQHLVAADTEDPLFLPEESRKALVIVFLAPICATVQFATLLSPRSAMSNQLLATCVESFAQLTFVDYMIHLLGGTRVAAAVLGRLRAKWWGWLVAPCCRRCGLRPCCSLGSFSSGQFRACYYLSIQNAILVPVITLFSGMTERNGDDGNFACAHVALSTSEAVGLLNVVSTVASVLSLQTLRRAVTCLLEPSAGDDPDMDDFAGRWSTDAALTEGYGELAAWPGFSMNAKFLAMKAAVIVSGITSSACSSAVREGYAEPRAEVCGGCPCYDRSVMAQMYAAFCTTVLLLPVALLAARAYPIEPAAARARDVLCLAERLAERGGA